MTPSTPIKTLTGIWKTAMEIITDGIENLKSAWKKNIWTTAFSRVGNRIWISRQLTFCCPCRGLISAIRTQAHSAFHETRTSQTLITIFRVEFFSAKGTSCFHNKLKYSITRKAIPPTRTASVIVKAIIPPACFQPSSRPRTAIVATQGI